MYDICVGEVQNKESKGIMTIAITHTNESWITLWIHNKEYKLIIIINEMYDRCVNQLSTEWTTTHDHEIKMVKVESTKMLTAI